jgi:hypothetical protein
MSSAIFMLFPMLHDRPDGYVICHGTGATIRAYPVSFRADSSTTMDTVFPSPNQLE